MLTRNAAASMDMADKVKSVAEESVQEEESARADKKYIYRGWRKSQVAGW